VEVDFGFLEVGGSARVFLLLVHFLFLMTHRSGRAEEEERGNRGAKTYPSAISPLISDSSTKSLI
jgi:hypothetical protein